MEAHGLGEDDMLEKLARQSEATTPLKVAEELDLDERGRVIRRRFVYEQVPELRARADALGKQMALLGHGSGATRRPLSEQGKSLAETEQRGQDVPLPKTVEEAEKLGVPYTIVHHPPEISREEWERNMQAYKVKRQKLLDSLDMD